MTHGCSDISSSTKMTISFFLIGVSLYIEAMLHTYKDGQKGVKESCVCPYIRTTYIYCAAKICMTFQ